MSNSITVSWSSTETIKHTTLKKGRSTCAYAMLSPANTGVCWESNNTRVVTINRESGIVYAQGVGIATITATRCDSCGNSDSMTIEVIDKVKVTGVNVCPESLSLEVGESYKLGATVIPSDADNQNVRWCSSSPAVASVDSITGCVTANSVGNVLVYARSPENNNIKNYCSVSVKPKKQPQVEKPKTNAKETMVADPIDVNSGAHVITNTLMTLYGGQGLKLTAHYNSSCLASGIMGVGWYHSYEKHLEYSADEIKVYSNPSNYSVYTSNNNSSVYTCSSPNKNGYVLTVDNTQQYPYVLNCNYECTEYYNSDGYIAKIVDHQGFETLISYTDTLITITDTVTNKKMYLKKDSSGKLEKVYDDAEREANLTYENNRLTEIKDLRQNSLRFDYDSDGCVLTGTDSKGTTYFTNTYDDCGRVKKQKDGIATSQTSIIDYFDETRERITKNRNGDTSKRIFDENGWLKEFIDENGDSKTYTYDERGNITVETDANGNSIRKTYNSFNKPTEIIDKNGNKTCMEYDSQGNVTKIIYPEINGVSAEETFVYNSRNQLLEHTDMRGTKTVYTYDNAAMPLTKKIGNKNAICYCYENGFLKSQTDSMGNTTSYLYNAVGQVEYITDADENVTHYEYDNCGNLLKTTYPNDKTIENTYDCNHQKTSVRDANGYKTNYIYNENMKLEYILFPNNDTIHYEYDGEDREWKVTNQAKKTTETTYDKVGRAVLKKFPDNTSISFEYDKVGNVIREVNQKGAITLKTYDANGNLLSVEDNDGNITRYQYNAMGKRIRAVNAASGAIIYEYSNAGDLLSETDALGNKKSYTYDDYGNVLTITDAKGNITRFTYDDNNNMLTARDALGNITTYTYDCFNNVETVTDAKNHTITYGYDVLGRRTTITDAKNRVFTTEYDGNGNVTKTVDAKGNTISSTMYNCLNLPRIVTDATGKTTNYTYTELGKVWTVTDSMNHTQTYLYDSLGRNTDVTDANNYTSHADYDELGNITKLKGPMGSVINYTYDDMGRLITESTSSGGTISYGYNALNVKEQLINARGQERRYFYDAIGRIIGYVGEEDSVSYTYDENGNVLTVTDKNGTIKREYDALNRVTRYIDTFGKSISYEYDAAGNLKKLTYPDNTSVNYDYDENNNLITVTDWEGRITSYSYDENNRVVGVIKPNGCTVTTVYDSRQRIQSTVEKTPTGTVIVGYRYEYDSLGRISTETHLAENKKMCYTYDSLNRVTARTIKTLSDEVISSESYTYDAAGNIIDAPDSCFTYDNNNRLTVFNGKSVSYDLDGNMLSDGNTEYEYDSANRLIKAGDHTYTYNAEDVRIRNLCSDADTTYTYNTNCKLSQLLTKTTHEITTKYVYGHGLIYQEKQERLKVFHYDYRGSTVAVTDDWSSVIITFKYDTYGNVIDRTGTTYLIFGYNGRDGVITDRNGLIYMRARYYSPEMRRFINADVLHGAISDSTSLNRYAYVNGNPVSFVDPFGMEKERVGQAAGTLAEYLWENRDTVIEGGMLAYGNVKIKIQQINGVDKIIIYGKRSVLGNKYIDIPQRIINADNLSQYPNIRKYIDEDFAVSEALSPYRKVLDKTVSVSEYIGVAGDVLNIATETYSAVSKYDNTTDKIYAGVGAASLEVSEIIVTAAASAKLGAAIGSAWCPVAGTIAGLVVGFAIGYAFDKLSSYLY